jgi:hypothetical protein
MRRRRELAAGLLLPASSSLCSSGPHCLLIPVSTSPRSSDPHQGERHTRCVENAPRREWETFSTPNPVLMNKGALHVAKLMKLMPCPPKPHLLQKGDDIILRGDFSWKRKFGRISLVYGSGPSVASLFRSFPFSDVLPTRRCVRR